MMLRLIVQPVRLLCLLCVFSWLGAADELQMSPEERAWIAAHPVVRIQMSNASPPFEFRDNGRWQGLAYDCLLAACARIGIRVEVTEMSWEQAVPAVATGQGVDLLLAVTRSPERERQMLLTQGYLSFPQVIIADHQRGFIAGLQDLRHEVVAVERDYVTETWLRRDLPEARLLVCDGTGPALAAVSEGRARAYVGNLAVASHLIERMGLVNLGVVAPSGYGDEVFAMGVRHDWPQLVALLDRAFAAMPPEEWQTLRQRWLSVHYDHGLRWTDILWWTLAVAAIALLFIVELRRMVAARTRELAREVERRREGEARFRLLVDRAPEAIVLLDPQSGTFIEANPMAEIIYGVPRQQILGARPEAFSPPVQPDGEPSADKARRVVAAALAGQDQVFPWLHVHPDGSEHPSEVRLSVLPWDGRQIIRCSVLDVSERHRYEARIRRNENLANLGLLAGSVAHDFNNALAGIQGYAELLGTETTNATQRTYIAKIVQAVNQAQDQTKRLVAFARQRASTPSPYDAHQAIATALDLFAAAHPRGIRTVRDLTAPRSRVLGLSGQLQNAVLNLCLNARDAMPQGGQVVVATQIVDLDAVAMAQLAPYALTPGTHLHVTVTDAGTGMEPAVLARCLDPLFTTKGDQGTGLGLPGVHRCVLDHRGALRIDSTPGRGTCVHLWLPLLADGPA